VQIETDVKQGGGGNTSFEDTKRAS